MYVAYSIGITHYICIDTLSISTQSFWSSFHQFTCIIGILAWFYVVPCKVAILSLAWLFQNYLWIRPIVTVFASKTYTYMYVVSTESWEYPESHVYVHYWHIKDWLKIANKSEITDSWTETETHTSENFIHRALMCAITEPSFWQNFLISQQIKYISMLTSNSIWHASTNIVPNVPFRVW